MKYKLLRYSLLSLLVMLCGGVFAEEVTMAYSGTTTSNMSGSNDAALLGLDETAWSVTGAKGGSNNFPGLNKDGDFRLYYASSGSNTVTVEAKGSLIIDSIAITFTGNSYKNASITVNDAAVEGKDGVFKINGKSFVIGNANTSNTQVRIKKIIIYYNDPSDTRTATAIEFSNMVIAGGVDRYIDFPTPTVKAGETTIENAAVEWSISDATVAENVRGRLHLLKAGTIVIKASYAGNETEYKPSSKSYTLTVTENEYDAISALQENATTTAKQTTFHFNGQQVVFVDGNYAYLSDGGHGAFISTAGHGLEAGQVLTGTATFKFGQHTTNKYLQLTGFSKEGLQITTADVIPVEMSIVELSTSCQSTLRKLKNVVYKADTKAFYSGKDSILYYNKFSVSNVQLVDGKKYDVTGIIILYYDSSKEKLLIEIAPRSLDDITEVPDTYQAYFKAMPHSAGNVTATPSSETYVTGTQVTLTQEANEGWEFVNWTGGPDGSTIISTDATCTVTISSDTTICANFQEKQVVPVGFQNFAIDLMNSAGLTGDEIGATNTKGIAVTDGVGTLVAENATNSVATIKGGDHKDAHGWTNFVASVKVDGPVKISFGTCRWGGNVTVKDAEGKEVVNTFTTNAEACYHENKEANIISAIYKGEATTLTIAGGSYVPYFAVESVNPEELAPTYMLTFSAGEGEGIVPAPITLDEGDEVEITANTNFYKEGYTLTSWSDGTNTYKVGDKFNITADVTLTAQYEANTVSLADRKTAVHLEWTLGEGFGAPTIALEGKTGFIVTQADVDGKKIDVKMDIDATNGKFNNAGRNDKWAQVNSGTKLTIPSCKGAFVCLEAYDNITTTTIDGQADYNQGQNIAYTVASTAETIDIVIGDGSYYSMIKVDLPVVQQEDNLIKEVPIIDTDFQDWTKTTTGNSTTIETLFSKENITFTFNNASVDPTATNDGKFNSATDPAYKGYILADKKEAYVTTTTFANITKIRYRHGATGSNRGWGLQKKGANDADWVTINEEKVSSPVWVEKDINEENVALRWYNLNTGQNAYMFELEVYANVKASGKQVTLTTRVSPEDAGSTNVYPIGDSYDEGTELTLTATKNFGYDFVSWTDAEGAILSTEAKFKYTLNANATVTANFKKVETYELDLTVDGTNGYMVTVNPEPTIVDEKAMYEAGTVVQLTANQYEGLVTFTNWSDGETQTSKTVKMDADVKLEAFFAETDIIAGWDFYTAGNSGRVADFFAVDNDAAALSLVNTQSGETSGWLDKSTLAGGGYESFAGAAVNWRTGTKNGDVGNWHWQTKVNAESFTDINVQFQMLYNYNAYQKYNVEYSLNGETWTNAGSVTMSGAKTAAAFNEALPAETNNQKDLYIRLIADKTSSVDGTGSANDGNTLAMFFITGTPKLVDDGTAPVLVSSVPVEGATGASATGKIVLNFDEKIKVAEGATASLSATPQSSDPEAWITLTPNVNGKTITFEYKGLEYATTYFFLLSGNTVSDLTDNKIADPVTFSFTTMERPAVTKGSFDVVVENIEQLQAALKAAETRADQNTRFRIFLKNGTYKFPQSDVDKTYSVELSNGSTTTYTKKDPITYFKASNVSLIGESRDGVIITNTTPAEDTFAGKYGEASIYEGIGNSDVIQIASNVSGLYWQDLTVKTGLGDARGRDIAIQDKGRMNIYKNTCLHGYQDTWTSNNDRGLYYFEGGVIRGRTDYICGKGDIYFNGVEFRQIAGGYLAVPSKPAKIGWVLKDCVINGEGDGVDGKYTLGRPWGQGTPVAVFIDTKMNVVPSAAGWNEMSGGWPARFAEFNSTSKTGSVIDLSGRKKEFGNDGDKHANNPVLTAAEALEYSDMHAMYGDWDPTLATEQAPAPKNVKIEGTTLAWDNSQYAFCWAVVKNGSIVAFTNEPTYTIDEASAKWSVRAANEMGGLGEAVEATVSDVTAIGNVNKVAGSNSIFDLQGRKVNMMKKGLYIINGKKVVIK